MWLFAILVLVPIIEIALFIQVGGAIGLWPTLAVVIATAFAGTVLLRSQGLATMNELQQSMQTGANPMQPIAHGALILVAGVLLLTPGFFTDLFGFLLFIPPFRRSLAWFVYDKIIKPNTHIYTTETSGPPHPNEDPEGKVIDGEFQDISDVPKNNRSDKQANTLSDKGKKGGKSPWQE